GAFFVDDPGGFFGFLRFLGHILSPAVVPTAQKMREIASSAAGWSKQMAGHNFSPDPCLTPCAGRDNHPSTRRKRSAGDVLQGAAADCNSAGETHAWFDSRVAHHFF